MANENEIKEELIKQMNNNSQQKSAKSPQEIIARDTARIKRLKWITAFNWLLVAICFIIKVFFEHARNSNVWIGIENIWLNSLFIILLETLLLIAVILTISLYIRSRTLTTRKIHMRLANIEELLKRMSQDK